MIVTNKTNLNNSISSKKALILIENKFLNFISLKNLGLAITEKAENNMYIEKYLRFKNKFFRQMYVIILIISIVVVILLVYLYFSE